MNKLYSLFVATLLASTFALTGCETIDGAGEDIETVGESVQDAVDNAKD